VSYDTDDGDVDDADGGDVMYDTIRYEMLF